MSSFKIDDVVRPNQKTLEVYARLAPWMKSGDLVVTWVDGNGRITLDKDTRVGRVWDEERFEKVSEKPAMHTPVPHGDAADRTFEEVFPPPPGVVKSLRQYLRSRLQRNSQMVAFWAPAPQSGKTTAADALGPDEYTPNVVRVSFASPLRRLIRTFLMDQGVSDERVTEYMTNGKLKEEVIPEVGKSFVELAIFLGTTFGRGFIGERVWVEAARREIARTLAATPEALIVNDDLRFRNELDMWRSMGGLVIGIHRPGATVSAQRQAAEGHLSFEDCDFVIRNSLTCPAGKDIFQAAVRVAVNACMYA